MINESLRNGEHADLIYRIEALGKPVAIYAEVLERGALEQFLDAMAHPAIVQGALMPDAHTGYSLPIGGVVASEGAVFPAFVGYDIGCGMVALPVSADPQAMRANAKNIFDGIYAAVPTGRKWNDRGTKWPAMGMPHTDVVKAEIDKAQMQLGSLGDGNHFIEVGEDESGQFWIVIHCGSRNLGHRVATHYMKLASGGDKAREGCFGLDADSADGQAYITDLNFALEFALANRREIARRVVEVIARAVPGIKADWSRLINRNHNHAERKDGRWVHRKGATHAEACMEGVIPGNMRDGSFIVRGKGSAESLCSSSHGAGRVLGRRKAAEVLSMDEFTQTMDGITARVDTGTLDESPFAYKSIFDVMRLQSDLVEVVAHSRPIINVKG